MKKFIEDIEDYRLANDLDLEKAIAQAEGGRDKEAKHSFVCSIDRLRLIRKLKEHGFEIKRTDKIISQDVLKNQFIHAKKTVELPKESVYKQEITIRSVVDEKIKIKKVYRGKRVLRKNEICTYVSNGKSWIMK